VQTVNRSHHPLYYDLLDAFRQRTGVPMQMRPASTVRSSKPCRCGSFIWTHYLSQVNPEWKSKVGDGTTVRWPTGTGGKGNDGDVQGGRSQR
jgi:hypothetical protein